MNVSIFRKLCVLAGLLMAATAVSAQTYPNRPVRLLVGYGPGGSPDIVGRVIAEHFTKTMGQTFIVDNRAGASGTLATALVAQSPADGYTLLVAETGQIEIAPQMIKLPYDPIADFTHIGQITKTHLIVMASAKGTQIKSLQELIREAKARPGKITYGTSGIGSGQHLAWEMFKNKAGVDLTHVPYKGATQSLPAVLSGEVDFIAGTWGALGQYAKAGNLRVIAVASTARSASAPDAPAIAEIVKGYEDYSSDIGLMAPRGLPPEILLRLSNAIRAALEAPDVKAKLDSLGFVATWSAPETYRDLIRQNLKKYELAIKISKIQPE